jgi:hypothetical protein
VSSPRESDLRTAEAATWSAKKGASFTRAAENPALYGRLYAAHCQALGLVLPERRQRGHRRPPRLTQLFLNRDQRPLDYESETAGRKAKQPALWRTEMSEITYGQKRQAGQWPFAESGHAILPERPILHTASGGTGVAGDPGAVASDRWLSSWSPLIWVVAVFRSGFGSRLTTDLPCPAWRATLNDEAFAIDRLAGTGGMSAQASDDAR